MSDTPRMRAAQRAAMEHMTGDVWRVGCDLERELNEANSTIRQQQLLDEEILRLDERAKRLKELGDELRECAGQIGWTSASEGKWIQRAIVAVEKWDKYTKF